MSAAATEALGPAATAPPLPSDPASGDDSLPAGTLVHQFEIIRELGRGGMGRVYMARDIRLGRRVALKFLLAASDDLRKRFLVEARNTARCHHDNIVVIYEADEWGGAPYMALEFLDGTALTKLIEEQPLPIGRAIEIVTAVVRALVRAHDHGIVHCDLKPDNILITHEGAVKVLDFGIAQVLGTDDNQTCGTPPYMAPEQWGADSIDHRTDLWAIGIILWELLTCRHPLGSITMGSLLENAATNSPMPRLAASFVGVSPAVDALIARCLAKSKRERFANARELLAALEAIAPTTHRVRDPDESPYPGMTAFAEQNADQFFGRDRDIARIKARVAESPLVVVAGPSGVGKSSLVRAGVIPALARGGAAWTTIVMRPGRDPLAALTARLAGLGILIEPKELEAEPGRLGVLLRDHAVRTHGRVLVFIDQFEELFTNVGDERVRGVVLSALAGAADEASSPVRVVLSVRSDFLDRIADDPIVRDLVSPGLVFARPLGPVELREALERPLDVTGYRFESDAIVDGIIADVGQAAGALPLVQFVASELWASRDRERKLLTEVAYRSLGGIAGSLAGHAEQVVRELPSSERVLLDAVLGHLVTAEGTRAVIDRSELETIVPGVGPLLDRLIAARLVASGTGDDTTVELVHESLIHAWPTLRRWREERGEHAAFHAQVRTAARQWLSRGKPAGLLWSGDAIADARVFRTRYTGTLEPHEEDFLDLAIGAADRKVRARRRLIAGGFVVTALIAAGAVVAVIAINDARGAAVLEAKRASDALESKLAADRARASEEQLRQQAQAAAQAASSERDRAETARADLDSKNQQLGGDLAVANDSLVTTNQQLKQALATATAEAKRAQEALKQADAARATAQAAEQRSRAAEAEQRARADAAEAKVKAAGLAKKLE